MHNFFTILFVCEKDCCTRSAEKCSGFAKLTSRALGEQWRTVVFAPIYTLYNRVGSYALGGSRATEITFIKLFLNRKLLSLPHFLFSNCPKSIMFEPHILHELLLWNALSLIYRPPMNISKQLFVQNLEDKQGELWQIEKKAWMGESTDLKDKLCKFTCYPDEEQQKKRTCF